MPKLCKCLEHGWVISPDSSTGVASKFIQLHAQSKLGVTHAKVAATHAWHRHTIWRDRTGTDAAALQGLNFAALTWTKISLEDMGLLHGELV